MIFETMLDLSILIFQREDKPYKPNELLKKLYKLYLRPLQMQCNWQIYRDQGKVWIPQKSLIVDYNLETYRSLFNSFLVDGKFRYKSAEKMLLKTSFTEEMITAKIQQTFLKSILSEKVK